jgi:hypothetical protein
MSLPQRVLKELESLRVSPHCGVRTEKVEAVVNALHRAYRASRREWVVTDMELVRQDAGTVVLQWPQKTPLRVVISEPAIRWTWDHLVNANLPWRCRDMGSVELINQHCADWFESTLIKDSNGEFTRD